MTAAAPVAEQTTLQVAWRRIDMAALRIGLALTAIGRDPRYTVQAADLHGAIGDLTTAAAAITDAQGTLRLAAALLALDQEAPS